MEKLVLALVHASRWLRRYFADHVITVLTNYRIGQILSKPEISGRLAKWAIELGGHTLVYKPRPAIKVQVLADFSAQVPANRIQECEEEQNPTPPPSPSDIWALYINGAFNEDIAGAGLRLISPGSQELTYAICLDFKSTNNEAEYEALLAGIRLVVKLDVQHLEAHVDSLLVAGQVRGDYAAKGDIMILYLELAKQLTSQFTSFKILHINMSENKPVDALSKLASTSFQHLAKDIRIEVLKNPSVPFRQVNVIQYGTTSWMTPIIRYLQSGIVPENKTEARKLQYKACHYQMGDGILYRKSYLGPLLRCVDPQDATYLVREIHEGICGIHAGLHMVVAKIMNAGYYWPGMHLHAVEIMRKCFNCQLHAPKTLCPKNNLIPVTTAWPFKKWAIDVVVPFLDAPVIPAEIGLRSPRMLAVNKIDNSDERRLDLDLLEESHENEAINEAKYKTKLEEYHNARVRICTFNVGADVLRNNEASNAERPGKLAPKWEGPYLIQEVLGKGVYKLQTLEGDPIARTWNTQ
ncbi:uncharacterized protein LOC110875606 [Helianthus annuus]|uniref:uncharacterized protein LOC110875606 n=1 Tax=Helianthus annuus TaxID=4232 RepID=UPI000B8F80AF|nr:uncharacterized protein LOC110875606 [Helianthus annuus]